MANTITKNRTWRESGHVGKLFLALDLTVVIDTPVANLDASVFGLRKVVQSSDVTKNNDTGTVVAVPSFDQTKLVFLNNSGAATNIPTGTYRLTVKGLST